MPAPELLTCTFGCFHRLLGDGARAGLLWQSSGGPGEALAPPCFGLAVTVGEPSAMGFVFIFGLVGWC